MRVRNALAAAAITLLAGCYVPSGNYRVTGVRWSRPPIKARPPIKNDMTQEECMILFSDISEIQGIRHELMDEMAEWRQKLISGKMTKKRFHRRRLKWLDSESRLRKEVTHMYDIGYARGCF